MYKHLSNFTNPTIQRHIVRIIFMIPIYAVASFLALLFRESAFYWVVARDCYEAYVLYSFFRLLIEIASGEEKLILKLERTPQMRYTMPFCCFHIKPGRIFLHRCKQMILQYVPIKLILAVLTFALEYKHLYGEGDFDFTRGYIYVAFTYNVSLTLTLYFLVLFYEATRDILSDFKPLLKFLCIKAIIFFSFWQSVLIAIIVWIGWIRELGDYSAEELSAAIQNLLICIELIPISILFYVAFSYDMFIEEEASSRSRFYKMLQVFRNILTVCNIMDVLFDSVMAIKPGPKRNVVIGDFLQLPRKSDQLTRVVHQGWIEKRGEDIVKIWKRRYALLLKEPHGIAYFKENPFDKSGDDPIVKSRGFIEINYESEVIEFSETRFIIANIGRRWKINCPSTSARDEWLKWIELTCTSAPPIRRNERLLD
eukprot:TRINITY_DN17722_c0_g1_i1.p1 TRINITY_DN17722_c0_g1~~TRINITY_DN17722_c0_g1_i1.p1  ORF type:complete len:482 (-),score=69.00 TRINITY_DN17722_c0_g1_i1:153-1427(-)